jgi:hypothetical protein
MVSQKCRRHGSLSQPSIATYIVFFIFFGSLLSACESTNNNIPTPIPSPSFTQPSEAISPFPILDTPTQSCFDGLVFLGDTTVPDDSIVTPGSTLDKRWLVQNSGTCNWDNRYRLRLINGLALSANIEQALFPARAGMQTILQIVFTAPLENGEYISEWQAFDPKGIPFGDPFFMKIIVQ